MIFFFFFLCLISWSISGILSFSAFLPLLVLLLSSLFPFPSIFLPTSLHHPHHRHLSSFLFSSPLRISSLFLVEFYGVHLRFVVFSYAFFLRRFPFSLRELSCKFLGSLVWRPWFNRHFKSQRIYCFVSYLRKNIYQRLIYFDLSGEFWFSSLFFLSQ